MNPAVAQDFIYVCVDGNLPAVKRFLAEGFPVDTTNEVDYTPLMAAARSYRVEVVAFLLQSGADVHRRDIYGHTPLHVAVGEPSTTPEKQAECVRLILEQGATVDAQDQSGITPLMSAAWFGCLPGIHHLLRHGASVTLRDQQGRTAEELARARRHFEIAEVLASHAAK
ncbi:MAG: ankyrin repeat domain-containing protein [Limisphaerales bacterium]